MSHEHHTVNQKHHPRVVAPPTAVRLATKRPPLRRPARTDARGVAAGLTRYFGIVPTIVRIAFVILTVVGGAGIRLYLASLLLIPDEGTNVSIAGSVVDALQSRSR